VGGGPPALVVEVVLDVLVEVVEDVDVVDVLLVVDVVDVVVVVEGAGLPGAAEATERTLGAAHAAAPTTRPVAASPRNRRRLGAPPSSRPVPTA
jgi:hypothetical protein